MGAHDAGDLRHEHRGAQQAEIQDNHRGRGPGQRDVVDNDPNDNDAVDNDPNERVEHHRGRGH